ncbi:class I SAM-dependent methyltransferase [Roseisolibacter agri]|uniref:Methyltransferase n=1 Tax=Roseisolibacter agri TaxID=2014610 RepID=A0AA37QD05_9BACT|nr:methyltransferase domain-containing protein [Roseisolibacter agri]GLC26631.1 methyltransferase [Roseisolibacter agri]
MTTPDASDDARHARLAESWEANADAWTSAVREGAIASRRAGTDAAIVAACAAAVPTLAGAAVLDVGCGEGWLARALAAKGARVLGVDASAPLIERARAAQPPADAPAPAYAVASYEAMAADLALARGPFDVIAVNFALLGDPVAPALAACAARLAPGGRVVVQTVHPWVAAGDGPYEPGWREETFAAFAVPFPSTMPWYFRTMAGWLDALRDAGLRLERVHEPLHPETRRPLSLVLAAGRD